MSYRVPDVFLLVLDHGMVWVHSRTGCVSQAAACVVREIERSCVRSPLCSTFVVHVLYSACYLQKTFHCQMVTDFLTVS